MLHLKNHILILFVFLFKMMRIEDNYSSIIVFTLVQTHFFCLFVETHAKKQPCILTNQGFNIQYLV